LAHPAHYREEGRTSAVQRRATAPRWHQAGPAGGILGQREPVLPSKAFMEQMKGAFALNNQMMEGGEITHPRGSRAAQRGDPAPDLVCPRASGPYWRDQVCPPERGTHAQSHRDRNQGVRARPGFRTVKTVLSGSRLHPGLRRRRGGLLPLRDGELPAAGPFRPGAGRAVHDAYPGGGRSRLAGPGGGEPDRQPLRRPGDRARHPAVADEGVLSVRPLRRAVADRTEHRLRGASAQKTTGHPRGWPDSSRHGARLPRPGGHPLTRPLLAPVVTVVAHQVADKKQPLHQDGNGRAHQQVVGQPATGAEQHPAPQLAIPGAKGGAGLQQARQQPEPGQGPLITRQRQRTGQPHETPHPAAPRDPDAGPEAHTRQQQQAGGRPLLEQGEMPPVEDTGQGQTGQDGRAPLELERQQIQQQGQAHHQLGPQEHRHQPRLLSFARSAACGRVEKVALTLVNATADPRQADGTDPQIVGQLHLAESLWC